MTEDEARGWICEHFGVPRETLLARFVDIVIAESGRQNLISAATLPQIWRRHIVDSAQLLQRVPAIDGDWFDIGTGAGFPGMVVAILSNGPVTLIEPRRKRADFLRACVVELDLGTRVTVHTARAEQIKGHAAVISARAVAALPELLAATVHLSTKKTRWVLPKGKSAREEVASAQATWHGVFHVEQSITDPESLIILAEKVARR
ncbi:MULTISPECIES: 16S rRNA (guanine(527)-N(7))-methyltransferase RsmG [Sphingomonas]|uniref:16S rRNA (guanine(527)-N(7))-methyltransferase RsmG n=1 Tax=Sphingomonas TaxID=13687 RepID=UPI00082D529B|nr:16S rRNA (guanine(527)-N(7))-methyltransferase RsmG [Sphingomonas sp. CCH10-B3]